MEHHSSGRFYFNFLPGDLSPCLFLIQCIFPSCLHREIRWSLLRAFCLLISDIYDYGNIYDAWRGLGSERSPSFYCPCKWDLSPACFIRLVKRSAHHIVSGLLFFFLLTFAFKLWIKRFFITDLRAWNEGGVLVFWTLW